MRDHSPALDAAICVLHGETDLGLACAALSDESLAHAVALAPSVDRVVRAVAALGGRLTSLLDPTTIANPAVQDAVRSLVGTIERYSVISSWAKVAPAGWGADIAVPLIDAVRKKNMPRPRCRRAHRTVR